MTNHVHLIADPGAEPKNLSQMMKYLGGRHASRMNRLCQRSGAFWEGRFKCSPIRNDRYLLGCIRYVDLNPVRADIVALPEDYQWSSYNTHIGKRTDVWLDSDPSFLALGQSNERRQHRYKEFVEQGIEEKELQAIRFAIQRDKPYE
jgi:putative transposase